MAAALAHVVRNKTEAAYARGDLCEKRRALMESGRNALTDAAGNAVETFYNAAVGNWAPIPAAANSAPDFPAIAPTALEVAENNQAGAPVGRVAAGDLDGDALNLCARPRIRCGVRHRRERQHHGDGGERARPWLVFDSICGYAKAQI